MVLAPSIRWSTRWLPTDGPSTDPRWTGGAATQAVADYRAAAAHQRPGSPGAEGESRRVPRDCAVQPSTVERSPVFVADYVLMGYGTGAIMCVPAQDKARLGVRRGRPVSRSSGQVQPPGFGAAIPGSVRRRRSGHQLRLPRRSRGGRREGHS
ncbi:MAG: hypothetical protein R2695_04695 [Acidimicrobiales bacterium]